MPDEFDDDLQAWLKRPALSAATATPLSAPRRRRIGASRLLGRLYATSNAPLRQRLLEALIQPLGALALVGVAAGAFAEFAHRRPVDGVRVALSDVARFTNDQVLELAHFVEQVSPEALQQCALLVSENGLGMAAFSASVAVLLYSKLRPSWGRWPGRRRDPGGSGA